MEPFAKKTYRSEIHEAISLPIRSFDSNWPLPLYSRLYATILSHLEPEDNHNMQALPTS